MLSAILILIGATQISAQSNESSAKDSQATVNAQASNDLADCSQMLDKTLEVLKSCEDLANKRLNEIYATRGEKTILESEVKYLNGLVTKLEKRINYLEGKKCSSFSIFFVIKWKWC